jgi:hypothetical protein
MLQLQHSTKANILDEGGHNPRTGAPAVNPDNDSFKGYGNMLQRACFFNPQSSVESVDIAQGTFTLALHVF